MREDILTMEEQVFGGRVVIGESSSLILLDFL